MSSLEHTRTHVDNTSAEIWTKQGSVSDATVIGTLLHEIYLPDWHYYSHTSIFHIPRKKKIISYVS